MLSNRMSINIPSFIPLTTLKKINWSISGVLRNPNLTLKHFSKWLCSFLRLYSNKYKSTTGLIVIALNQFEPCFNVMLHFHFSMTTVSAAKAHTRPPPNQSLFFGDFFQSDFWYVKMLQRFLTNISKANTAVAYIVSVGLVIPLSVRFKD